MPNTLPKPTRVSGTQDTDAELDYGNGWHIQIGGGLYVANRFHDSADPNAAFLESFGFFTTRKEAEACLLSKMFQGDK